MYLCNDDHDEICFEGRDCPLCAVISDKNSEITKLETTIENLESDNAALHQQLNDQP